MIKATPETIYNAVINALKLAQHKKIISLAFPLMCSRPGYSILPDKKASKIILKIMTKAIHDFDNNEKHTIKTIFFCLNDKRLISKGYNLITSSSSLTG